MVPGSSEVAPRSETPSASRLLRITPVPTVLLSMLTTLFRFFLNSDVNFKVTRSGLQHDRGDGSSSILLHSSPSSRSFASTRQDCLDRMRKKPSGNAAASSRWQDDGRTLDPVPPSPWYTATKGKKSGPPSQESGAALRSLPRDLGLGLPDYAPQEGSTDVDNVWPQSRPKIRPIRWLFAETPMQSNFLPAHVDGAFKVLDPHSCELLEINMMFFHILMALCVQKHIVRT